MKRIIALFFLTLMPYLASAQSVLISRSLELLPNSQAVVMFNNIFGNWENKELDDPFPYVVIQMHLSGDENAIRMAKQKINLDLGTMYKVEAADRNQPNKILFLVPKGVRNMYILCGEGCEKQLLYSGTLIANKVYDCTIVYKPSADKSADNTQDIMSQIEDLKKQNEQMRQTMEDMQQNQSNNANLSNAQNADAQTHSPGEVREFEVKGVKFKMIKVVGGTFQMGQSGVAPPVHSVTLSDYYIGETEVTQALWDAVMGKNKSSQKGDSLPVDKVNVHQCKTFLRKLSKLTGCKFTFPTEAQWEYAARGGNKSKGYEYSGSNNVEDVAWLEGVSLHEMHPVATKMANELGLYDMSGNVWEWCKDWYESYSSKPQTNPTGMRLGIRSFILYGAAVPRIKRGGSCFSSSGDCRSTDRATGITSEVIAGNGLRLALIP